MYYVYEIVNLFGTIEYVGETNNPKLRFINHKCKNGIFYKRQDIIMNVLDETYNTKKEAFLRQIELQKEYNLITDIDKCALGGKACNSIDKNKKYIKKLGQKWGVISSKEIHICPKCGKSGKGASFYTYHFDNCRKIHQIDYNTGAIINIFDSGMEAQKITGIDNTSISRCINGKLKSSGGYIWKAYKI
jgi:predicted GIY-YIG superfamily endonuclease